MTALSPTQYYQFDALVIGAGGAGLMSALHTAKGGMQVACITKVPPTRSHTVAAKGGINAALGNITEDDWRWHMYDTIRGSDWLADQDAVALLCERAPLALRELEQMGVPFSRAKNGKLDQRVYGGQSTQFGEGEPAHRAAYAADRTGHAILHTLYQQALKHRVRFFTEYVVIDLLMEDGQCHGVLALSPDSGELCVFQAKVVILATGGHGQIYQTTTSSSICTGDGAAMVARAGLPLQDMEFVQFHPTGLYGSGFLITEAARAEGGILLNGQGERFMERYAPRYMELAPRDVIARAISQEVLEGRGAGQQQDHVLLDLSHIPTHILQHQLPEVLELARRFAGVDATTAPIPILPSVHYMMGGIPTDVHCRVQNQQGQHVPGLYAVGEAACVSVHGANRLGCNSLLDLIVFARVASEHIGENYTHASPLPKLAKTIWQAGCARIEALLQTEKNPVADYQKQMQKAMDQYVGVYRHAELLLQGKDALAELYQQSSKLSVGGGGLLWNMALHEALEYQNLILLAYVTVASALQRTESRGSHFRDDFPQRDDTAWLSHSQVSLQDGSLYFSKSSVRMDVVLPNQPVFPPKARKY